MKRIIFAILILPSLVWAQYNGAGTFIRPYNWVNDAAANIPITASRMDGDMNAVVGALNNAVTRDGQGYFSANIKAGNHFITGLEDGTSSTPSVASYSQTTTGMYFASGTVGITSSGTQAASFTSTGAAFPVGISAPVVINAPSSGTTTLTLTSQGGNDVMSFSSINNAANGSGFLSFDASASMYLYDTAGSGALLVGTSSTANFAVVTNNASRVYVNTSGNVSVNQPTSGPSLTIETPVSGNAAIVANGAGLGSGSGTSTMAIRAVGSYGGGIGFEDPGQGFWGIFDSSGTIDLANNPSSNSGALTTRFQISPSGVVGVPGSLSVTGALSVSGATSLAAATGSTPTTGDNSTNLATTAFVQATVPITIAGSFTCTGYNGSNPDFSGCSATGIITAPTGANNGNFSFTAIPTSGNIFVLQGACYRAGVGYTLGPLVLTPGATTYNAHALCLAAGGGTGSLWVKAEIMQYN